MILHSLFMRSIFVAFICAMTGTLTLVAQEEANKTRQWPHSVDVFRHGEGGYHTFRIPSLTVVPDGALVAIAEGRRERANDPGGGTIHLVYKRSTDGGESWGALKVLDDPGEEGSGASNPTAVLSRFDLAWLELELD